MCVLLISMSVGNYRHKVSNQMKNLWKQVLTMMMSFLLTCGFSLSVSAKSKSDKSHKDTTHSAKAKTSKKSKKTAEETPVSTTPSVADPKTDAIVHDVSNYYSNLKSLRTRLIQRLNASTDSKTVELLSVVDVAVKKPDMIAINLRAGMPGGSLYCDGNNAYFYSQILNKYTVKPAADDYEKLFADANSRYVNGRYAMFSLLPSLLSKNPYSSIMAGVQKTDYIGTEDVDGTPCHHMRFSQDKFVWDLWVDAGAHPWIVKVSPDLFSDTSGRGRAQHGAKMSLSFRYKNWVANSSIKNKEFVFVSPPESSEAKTFVTQGIEEDKAPAPSSAPAPAPAPAEDKSPLVGKPAPEFKLATVGGSDVTLATHKGSDIVVLDFWASWCPPCREGLPIVSRVTKALNGKHVVFYAVNVGEDADTIKQFLTSRNLDITALMDKDKKVSNLYKVNGIPQTVIIDKNGIVQSVEIGFSRNMEQGLTTKLNKLVDQ